MITHRIDYILIPYSKNIFDIDRACDGVPNLGCLQFHLIQLYAVLFDNIKLLLFARVLHDVVQKSRKLGFFLVSAVFSRKPDSFF